MTYLNPPRLHFAGKYLANVSTVNNAPVNIAGDSGTGQPPADTEDTTAYRDIAWKKTDNSIPGGLFNPDGGNEFGFKDVTVRSAVGPGDVPVTGKDPVLGLTLATPARLPAKMADLDTDEEMTSTIYGLEITLRDPAGPVYLRARMTPASSIDIWRRLLKWGNKMDRDLTASSGAYQSTLTDLVWSDMSSLSPLLMELRQGSAADQRLSIKFNVDAYNQKWLGGRIVGTIGLATAAEPVHMLQGRHLGTREILPPHMPGFHGRVPVADASFWPLGGINFFPAVVDLQAGKLRLDLGNALPVEPLEPPDPLGPVHVPDIGELTPAYRDADKVITPIGPPIDYREAGRYARTAGVVDLPLTPAELDGVRAGELLIVGGPERQDVLIEEPRVHVQAEEYVFRMDAGTTRTVRLRVTELGEPMANATVTLAVRDPYMQWEEPPEVLETLREGLTVTERVTTDASGVAEVTLTSKDPGEKRFFNNGTSRGSYDGQIYAVTYRVGEDLPPNPSNRLAVLVWNKFPARSLLPGEKLSWNGEIGPVLRSFGNLYPVMTKVCAIDLDTADYDKVVERAQYIAARLRLDVSNPRYMPVTRNLSGQRKAAILEWLDDPVLDP